MRFRQWLLFLVLVVPGVFCFVFCMYYALLDWAALQKAYANFERVASSSSSMSTLFVAEAKQNIHRINLFADVVWRLSPAIFAHVCRGVSLERAITDNATISSPFTYP